MSPCSPNIFGFVNFFLFPHVCNSNFSGNFSRKVDGNRVFWRKKKKCMVELVKFARPFPQMQMIFDFASHVGGHAWRNIDTTRLADIHVSVKLQILDISSTKSSKVISIASTLSL